MTTAHFPTPDQDPLMRGDTFDALAFTFAIDGLREDLTDYTLQSQIRYSEKTGKVYHEMSIGDGITITDAAQGEFEVDEFLMDWPAGKYYWDIEFIKGGVVKTYFSATITLSQDVTNKKA